MRIPCADYCYYSSGAKGARTGTGIKQYRVTSDDTASDAVLAPLRMVKVGR